MAQTDSWLADNVILAKAKELDPYTTADDIKVTQSIIMPQVCAPAWFHEVLIAASMVDASEEALLQSLIARGRSVGEIGETYMEADWRNLMLNWKRFCIEKNRCRHLSDHDFWILDTPAILSVVVDLIDRYTPVRAQLSSSNRRIIGNYVKRHVDATRLTVADKFNVHPVQAESTIAAVMSLFTQPAWFYEFLRSNADELHSSIISQLMVNEIRELNRRNKAQTRGGIREAIRAWVKLVINNPDSGNANFYRGTESIEGIAYDFVYIRKEAIAKYFSSA
jgi:hypothetical protein